MLTRRSTNTRKGAPDARYHPHRARRATPPSGHRAGRPGAWADEPEPDRRRRDREVGTRDRRGCDAAAGRGACGADGARRLRRGPGRRDDVHLARALLPHGPHAALHRSDRRGRHRARRDRVRRPDAQGRRARPGHPPRRGSRCELRRRRDRRDGADAEPAIPQARARRAPARRLQVRDDARRQGRDQQRRLAVDLGRVEPRAGAPLARRVGRRGRRDRHRARRRPAPDRAHRGRRPPAAPGRVRLRGAPAARLAAGPRAWPRSR